MERGKIHKKDLLLNNGVMWCCNMAHKMTCVTCLFVPKTKDRMQMIKFIDFWYPFLFFLSFFLSRGFQNHHAKHLFLFGCITWMIDLFTTSFLSLNNILTPRLKSFHLFQEVIICRQKL